MIIKPAKSIKGTLSLPGDKSISHRAAILAALAVGTTRIENFAPGADCASTLSCLKQLGVEIECDGNTVTISGKGKTGLKASSAELDCGNSGSTMRMLAGVLAGQNFTSVLTGDESLSKRPMERIISPLTRMGAVIESTDGHAPLKIKGKYPLKAISYTLPKPSAQVKSCVLLAGLFGNGATEVVEFIPTRDHTERILPYFSAGVHIREIENNSYISLSGNTKLRANDFIVPGDISSAAFFIIAAACLPGSELTLCNLGFNPSRTAMITLLEDFGINIEIKNKTFLGTEPVADVLIKHTSERKRPYFVNEHFAAALIDEVPILAVFGTQVEKGFEIRDVQELRIKESDRIKSTVENLKLMGATVEEFPDGLRVGRSNLKGAAVDSFGDHRIAMAFAIAGLLAEGETEITGSECVNISYPGFFDTMEEIVIR